MIGTAQVPRTIRLAGTPSLGINGSWALSVSVVRRAEGRRMADADCLIRQLRPWTLDQVKCGDRRGRALRGSLFSLVAVS